MLEIRDNVPVDFRTKDECKCCPQDYRNTIFDIFGQIDKAARAGYVKRQQHGYIESIMKLAKENE